MLADYRQHVAERAAKGIAPQPINAVQMASLVELLKKPPAGEEAYLLELLTYNVPSGVDEAAYIKSSFLAAITKEETKSPLLTAEKAIELLGTMQGGYNIVPLLDALNSKILAPITARVLKNIILIFDNFYEVAKKAHSGNIYAHEVIISWANAEWFLSRPKLAEKITVTVFKVTGETNTDDLSPATDAWSRSDIPLHALSMLKHPREGIFPDQPGNIGPIKQINFLKKNGYPLAYVGDVIGTGSSRKSATNSLVWFMGDNIPYVPNKRVGGIVLGNKIAPIFFNTMEDAGALPIEVDVSCLKMGDVIDIYPFQGKICQHDTSKLLTNFTLNKNTLVDEVRAGGRISLMIGRDLTTRACKSLMIPSSAIFNYANDLATSNKGYTLAQKIVGRACGIQGVRPGQYCEPKITSVGSQDTTGPMTRDELKDLACLAFSADLVMQSFCHTAAYPKPIDMQTHHTLPKFIINRGGISLRPGDGIIHSWLNRMLLPDTVGTGGDSHTRFPIGISFPAGSGLVAFAAATGIIPLDMPESVLVRFKGTVMHPGITLRDLVHAIPYYAIRQGLLTVDKKSKQNIFAGRILEIEGLPQLPVDQAFELADASAERSTSGCTIKLDQAPIIEYLHSNIVLLKWMIWEGYGDRYAIERRIKKMESWLVNPTLLSADDNAEYVAIIDIDIADITEPILCIPNDPDDVHLLSEINDSNGRNIIVDEVFIGSCMTHISHFRAVGKILELHKYKLQTKLWIAPPTKMDATQLIEEGYYRIFLKSGAKIEIPGCSLCMGNQARVMDGATVVSTSTRNFPNRMGNNANVYLVSAELAAVTAVLGHLPTVNEYLQTLNLIDKTSVDTYRWLNFAHLSEYLDKANKIIF